MDRGLTFRFESVRRVFKAIPNKVSQIWQQHERMQFTFAQSGSFQWRPLLLGDVRQTSVWSSPPQISGNRHPLISMLTSRPFERSHRGAFVRSSCATCTSYVNPHSFHLRYNLGVH